MSRNPEPLGTNMNNVDCSRLETVLTPRHEKVGRDYEDMEFSKVIVGTAECTNRLTMYTNESVAK